jgi:glycosyltransferase involved in cell wall biosynthesis
MDVGKPMVTIVIPVFNGGEYLAEAIESALAQTYDPIEIVVVNDGSTDSGETEQVARRFEPKIRYFEKQNGGVSSALNFGIAHASGEYISWLSHDDAYYEDKISKQMSLLDSLSIKRVVLYSNLTIMDSNSKCYAEFSNPPVAPSRFYEALLGGMVVESLFKHPQFGLNGCTTLIPKVAFAEVGDFDPIKRATQDYDMWFRMNTKFDFIGMPDRLLKSRVHKGQGTHQLGSAMAKEVSELYLDALEYYQRGSRKFDLDLAKLAFALRFDVRREGAYLKVQEMASKEGRTSESLKYLMAARLMSPGIARLRIAAKNGRMLFKKRV